MKHLIPIMALPLLNFISIEVISGSRKFKVLSGVIGKIAAQKNTRNPERIPVT